MNNYDHLIGCMVFAASNSTYWILDRYDFCEIYDCYKIEFSYAKVGDEKIRGVARGRRVLHMEKWHSEKVGEDLFIIKGGV